MTKPRTKAGASWQYLYKTGRWQKVRAIQLNHQPLCRICLEDGHLTAANVVDHIRQHQGNEALFFDPANLQSLCKLHHDSVKQSEERTGRAILPRGADGWPIS